MTIGVPVTETAPDKTLTELVDKLRAAFGPDLVSVILYGSAATGDYQRKFSDFNILCVLAEITPKQLGASEPVVRWWREKGNPSPLLLSSEEVLNSTDCFPIEFHDIREHHRVLFGEDVTVGMQISDNFYRAQVEHDLRAKLLRLRQKASGILSDTDVLRRLLVDSVATFCVLVRHALILKCGEAPAKKREVVHRAGQILGLDPAPFVTLLDLREETGNGPAFDPSSLLAKYMKEIEKVIGAVDALATLHEGEPHQREKETGL